MRLPRRSHSLLRAFLLAFFLVASLVAGPQTAWAQSSAQPAAQLPPAWNDAVARLASKIAGLAGPQKTISVTAKNISSLTEVETTGIRQALDANLLKRGFHVAGESSAETQTVLTLSEGEQGYVWVAEVRRGSNEETVIVSAPKRNDGVARQAKPVVSLQRKIVWTQPERFTDFSVSDVTADGIQRMLVLEPTRLFSYHFTEGRWQKAMLKPLHPAAFPPRDARGTISGSSGEFDAYLPGESCAISAWSDEGDLNCASDLPMTPEMDWPLVAGGTERGDATFQTNRNYFDGLTTVYGQVEAKLPEFFTGAVMNTQDDTHWIVTELDGKARLYDTSAKPSATFSGWGDDIASVVTGCDGDWQVLVTGTGDWTQPDHIQIYDIRDRQATPVGQTLEFPGPILALWPSTDMRSARVVSRNLQTGMYEASIVSVTCSE
jgi:hypothetical protein